ncbi:hypothetical protein U1701_18335 [Sphingomonas sp. PB2P19]|uniref:hypothetical protein n=1 Tax=Sphingomonas rhamnosi TaxID=3096156 RepID=UPI002FCB644D
MSESVDHLGLIADAAIAQLGAHAKAIERVAMRLPDNADRKEIVWLIESLRDQGQLLRERIGPLTGPKR